MVAAVMVHQRTVLPGDAARRRFPATLPGDAPRRRSPATGYGAGDASRELLKVRAPRVFIPKVARGMRHKARTRVRVACLDAGQPRTDTEECGDRGHRTEQS